MTLRCVFRVAAGPRLGFGHLMRARALARALGVAPVVSIRGGAAAMRAARSLGCHVLRRRDDVFSGAAVVVVDEPSPAHRRSWLRKAAARGVASVAVVDGSATVPQAGLIVNGAIGASRRASASRVLAGSRFYILDGRIEAARRKTESARAAGRCPRVLVSLGGGAHVKAAAAAIVGALRARWPDAAVDVAAGFTSGRRPRIDGARWLVRRGGLAGALSAADVAIVGGGVTLYEACAIGVPVVGLAVVHAQRRAIRTFAASGAVLDAGGPGLGGRTLRRVADSVEQLLDHGTRRRVSRRARQLVDARGADRVAAEIRRLVRTQGDNSRG